MSETTKGPWEVSGARTVEGNFMVCAGEGHEYGIVAEVLTKEDADLIASLPDLLADRTDKAAAWDKLAEKNAQIAALMAERDALRKALADLVKAQVWRDACGMGNDETLYLDAADRLGEAQERARTALSPEHQREGK